MKREALENIVQRHRRDNQKNYCWYCGIRTRRSKEPVLPEYRTRDHVHPASLGGKRRNNIVFACHSCNQNKGSLSYQEFRDVLGLDDWDLFWGQVFSTRVLDVTAKRAQNIWPFIEWLDSDRWGWLAKCAGARAAREIRIRRVYERPPETVFVAPPPRPHLWLARIRDLLTRN